MSEPIPAPTPEDLMRSADEDYTTPFFVAVSGVIGCWIRRAAAAESALVAERQARDIECDECGRVFTPTPKVSVCAECVADLGAKLAQAEAALAKIGPNDRAHAQTWREEAERLSDLEIKERRARELAEAELAKYRRWVALMTGPLKISAGWAAAGFYIESGVAEPPQGFYGTLDEVFEAAQKWADAAREGSVKQP